MKKTKKTAIFFLVLTFSSLSFASSSRKLPETFEQARKIFTGGYAPLIDSVSEKYWNCSSYSLSGKNEKLVGLRETTTMGADIYFMKRNYAWNDAKSENITTEIHRGTDAYTLQAALRETDNGLLTVEYAYSDDVSLDTISKNPEDFAILLVGRESGMGAKTNPLPVVELSPVAKATRYIVCEEASFLERAWNSTETWSLTHGLNHFF